MALAGQNQVRHIYVAKSAKAVATVGAIDGGAVGDLAVVNANGEDAAVASGSKFLIVSKETKGTVTSDVVNPVNITSAKSVPYVAKTSSVGTIGGLTVNLNTLYAVEIAISSFGSYSAENEYIKKAFYQAVTGNDQENIVDGLITSLNRNFAREVGADLNSNPYFNFYKGATAQTIDVDTPPTADNSASVSVNGVAYAIALLDLDTDQEAAAKIAAVLDGIAGISAAAVATSIVTITSTLPVSVVFSALTTGLVVTQAITASSAGLVISEKLTWAIEQFDADKKTRQGISFSVNASFETLPTILDNTSGVVGSGTYMQVAEIEFYLKGERGDFMRGMGYPHNLPAGAMEAVAGETYDIIELGYFEEGRDEAKKSKKGMTIALPVSDRAASNNFITELNVAIPGAIVIATLS